MTFKRVVLAHNFLGPHGGAERSTYKTYQLLQQAGYEVYLFGCNMQPYFESFPHSDLFPDYVNYDEIRNPIQALSVLSKPFYNQQSKQRFREFLQRVQPDLVHFGSIHWHLSPSIIEPCVEMNLPSLMTLRESRHVCPAGTLMRRGHTYCKELLCAKKGAIHAFSHRCYEGSTAKSLLVAAEFAYRQYHGLFERIHHYICPSQALANLVIDAGTPQEQVSVIPNFVDDAWLSEPAPSVPGEYFLYAGRLSVEKGVGTLLRAAAQVDPNLPIKIAGEGPQQPELADLAQQLGLTRTEFLGSVKGENMKSLYRNAIANVLPCNWFENFPRTVLESHAVGRPVIASDIGGIPEMVLDGETGLLVTPGDVDSLAAALRAALAEPEQMMRMGLKGQQLTQAQYSANAYFELLLESYQNVYANVTRSISR